MRRHRSSTLAVTLSAALLSVALAACTSSGSTQAPATALADPTAHPATTIDVWSFTKLPNEVAAFKASFDDLRKQYPWLTVNFVPNKDDAAFAKAVAAGNPPDVFIADSSDNLGKFCFDGTVLDVDPYLKAAGIDPVKTFPEATLGYTRFDDKQCGLPLLTDVFAMYYNKKLFAEAGITTPPKTLSELTADAKKLTVKAADGTVSRFGFVPRWDFNLNRSLYGGQFSGARFFDDAGKSTLGSDPSWADLLAWDRDLITFYGQAQVQRFVGTYNAHTDDANNAFATGKVAIDFNGEWHIGELAEQAPTLDYGIAAFPVLDSAAATYGGGIAGGTVVYLPSRGKHLQESFFAAKQLATDTAFLHKLAGLVSNVPTTFDALSTWDQRTDPHWAAMMDVFTKTKVLVKATSASGVEGSVPWDTFIQDFEAGKVTDATAGLKQVAAKTDEINAQARR